MTLIDISNSEEIYTVSRLSREVRFLLEGNFPALWVEGEISNFSTPHSGHWYFTLKDAHAQIRCAMFKPQNRLVGWLPKEGTHVFLKARVSLYEGRGDFQLLVEQLEEAGEGRLRQAFEALKKRLYEAGLFADIHKKKLPSFPTIIGLITSATGAAIRDVLSVLKRRFPYASIIIYPSLVQGESAATSLVEAIQLANQRQECDVIILARGGGSLEDLWPFNEEKVAYAIHASVIPLISGVGHEIDFTIADFVADLRAPTPSAAAELVVPHQGELLELLQQLKKQLIRLMNQQLHHFQQQLSWIKKHLQQQHPKIRVLEQIQQIDLCETKLFQLQTQILTSYRSTLLNLQTRLKGVTPKHQLRELQNQLNNSHRQLQHAVLKMIEQKQQQLQVTAAQLDVLSPLSTLKRGYAIALDKKNSILYDINQVKVGDNIQVKLMKGELTCKVEKKFK